MKCKTKLLYSRKSIGYFSPHTQISISLYPDINRIRDKRQIKTLKLCLRQFPSQTRTTVKSILL